MSLRKIESQTGGSNLEPVSAGTHVARCWRMVELGTQEKFYDGQSQGFKTMVHIAFEVYDEPRVYDQEKGEEPAILGKKFVISMHEKAALRKALQSWRGQDYSQAEIDAGVDITKVVGAPCLVNVVNKELDGRKIGFIDTITPLMKGQTAPEQHNANCIYETSQMLADFKANGNLDNYKMPDFMKKMIIEDSKEFQGISSTPTPTQAPAAAAAAPTTGNEPPF